MSFRKASALLDEFFVGNTFEKFNQLYSDFLSVYLVELLEMCSIEFCISQKLQIVGLILATR